jgi:hypothetical protein
MAMTSRTAPAGKDDGKLSIGTDAPKGEQVTYIPRDGDPPKTKWRGIVFHANVPKTITDVEHIDAARNSKFFHVGAFDPSKDSTAAIDEPEGQPKNATQYRAHVVAWLKKTGDINQFVANWKSDLPLQQFCEVGTDDFNYLGTLLRPKMHELMVAANMNDLKLAELFARNGIYQLPF